MELKYRSGKDQSYHFFTSIGLCGIEMAFELLARYGGERPQSDCVELKYEIGLLRRGLARTSIGLCGIEIRNRPRPVGGHHDLNRTVWN